MDDNNLAGAGGHPGLNNVETVYMQTHAAMMKLFRSKDHDKAERIAKQLLQKVDLPDLIRGRCNLVLACGDYDYLNYAQQAFEIFTRLEEEYDDMPKVHLENARRILARAQQHSQEEADGTLQIDRDRDQDDDVEEAVGGDEEIVIDMDELARATGLDMGDEDDGDEDEVEDEEKRE